MEIETFRALESEVRSYCRKFPVVFQRAEGSTVVDSEGKSYIDFFCSASSLNYGHNEPTIKSEVIRYLQQNGICSTLDLHTEAKRTFLETFQELILGPRDLRYKMQFTSPSGASAVEASIKLARRITGRDSVVSFTNGFHGMTAGALCLTGNKYHRQNSMWRSSIQLPFDGYLGDIQNTMDYFKKLIEDPSSGFDLPAAVIVEPVQAEGGIRIASNRWLKDLRSITRDHGILLIMDEIQTGCGRTGPFFSFERAGIVPDIICLAKSIGGLGLPMAIVLISEALDKWNPGEDSGTFRGNNLAFVAATAALKKYWSESTFSSHFELSGDVVRGRLELIGSKALDHIREVRGVGMMFGIEFYDEKIAGEVVADCFSNGLIVEACGPRDEVIKIIPALNISAGELADGLDLLEMSVQRVVQKHRAKNRPKVQPVHC